MTPTACALAALEAAARMIGVVAHLVTARCTRVRVFSETHAAPLNPRQTVAVDTLQRFAMSWRLRVAIRATSPTPVVRLDALRGGRTVS